MKARYVAVYRMRGYTALPATANPSKIADLKAPALSATLTTDPEPHLIHIDKSGAIGRSLLTSKFNANDEKTTQANLAEAICAIKSARGTALESGVFVVFEGEIEIPPVEFQCRWDLSDFGVCIDDVDRYAIGEEFDSGIECVMTALSIGLPVSADHRFEKLGDAVFLVDLSTEKPIYARTSRVFAPGVFVASQMTEANIQDAAEWTAKIAIDKTMARPINLLAASLNKANGELQSYVAAWSALEIFVHATFKSTYSARWFDLVERGGPAAAKPIVARLKEVMGARFGVADKFLIIASLLDPDIAADNADEFITLKKTRDEFLHGIAVPISPLPTGAIQKLLMKHMKLHLAS